nr:unnamed protein product [Digitaria exilis]
MEDIHPTERKAEEVIIPICRTMSDAVRVLDAIVGYDSHDALATKKASRYIPEGGYMQFLRPDGLKGKRIGIPNGFFNNPNGTVQNLVFRQHLDMMRYSERLKEFGQLIFLVAETTTGIGGPERTAILELKKLSAYGLEKLMKDQKLDAIVTPNDSASSVLAIGGMPGITVPAGYGKLGVPFGICFGGLKGYEPRLIEIAYAFEQATQVRKIPTFSP